MKALAPQVPRRFPIRLKLAAALAVPVIILLVVALSQVLQVRGEAREVNEQAELALAAEGPGSLFDALQNERTATYLDMIGMPKEEVDFDQEMEETRPLTDQAVDDFEALLSDKPNRVQDIYAPALDALGRLGDIRDQVDGYSGPRNYQPQDFAIAGEVFSDAYSEVIKQLTDANLEATLAIDDADLRVGAELGRLASRQGDLVARLTMHLVSSIVQPEILRAEMVQISALQGELETNDQLAHSMATGPYGRLAEEHLEGSPEIEFLAETVRTALETGKYDFQAAEQRASTDGPGDVTADTWSYGKFRMDVAEELKGQAKRLTDDAANRQRLYIFLGLLAVTGAGIAAWVVSRSITRPLRSLTGQATTMADERLPTAVQNVLETPLGQDVAVPHVAPVIVETNDEVLEVADALNTVQDSALSLAVEQAMLRRNIADSFVNLGRRNQKLVSRQLDFITELEQNETDPDTLANLFRLDHLATRMRRNAESLLVLAGVDPPRKWVAPVRLVDVIRAALGEVEDYQRVEVHDLGPVSIVGSAAADLAHLLAELLENALVFSAATQPVEVRGQSPSAGAPVGRPPGSSNATAAGYALAIIDKGMGMHQDGIAQANRRLAGGEAFTVAPSKYLGHYVAGIIAARHGIDVQLHSGPNLGVTAAVTLPASLLATGQREIPPGPTPAAAPRA